MFLFDSQGVDADGKILGDLKPTGIRPKFSDKLADHGIKLNPAMFDPGGGMFDRNGGAA